LEVGYFAKSGSELHAAARRRPFASMPVECQTPAIEDRAVEVHAWGGPPWRRSTGGTEQRFDLTLAGGDLAAEAVGNQLCLMYG